MMPIKQLGIAVIGDEDLVSGMRLAGIGRYYLIKGDGDTGEEVRQALSSLIGEPDIGVIVIPEDYTEYVSDLLTQVREGKKMTPVIVEVPSKFGTRYGDVREYYKGYARAAIGFDIEI